MSVIYFRGLKTGVLFSRGESWGGSAVSGSSHLDLFHCTWLIKWGKGGHWRQRRLRQETSGSLHRDRGCCLGFRGKPRDGPALNFLWTFLEILLSLSWSPWKIGHLCLYLPSFSLTSPDFKEPRYLLRTSELFILLCWDSPSPFTDLGSWSHKGPQKEL